MKLLSENWRMSLFFRLVFLKETPGRGQTSGSSLNFLRTLWTYSEKYPSQHFQNQHLCRWYHDVCVALKTSYLSLHCLSGTLCSKKVKQHWRQVQKTNKMTVKTCHPGKRSKFNTASRVCNSVQKVLIMVFFFKYQTVFVKEVSEICFLTLYLLYICTNNEIIFGSKMSLLKSKRCWTNAVCNETTRETSVCVCVLSVGISSESCFLSFLSPDFIDEL